MTPGRLGSLSLLVIDHIDRERRRAGDSPSGGLSHFGARPICRMERNVLFVDIDYFPQTPDLIGPFGHF
jgi:hypothetical protein